MSYQRSGRPPPKDGSYGGGGYNSAPSKSRGYPYVPGFYTRPQGYPSAPRPGCLIAGAQSPNVQSQGVSPPPRPFWSVDAVPVPTGVEKDKGNSYVGNVGDRPAVGNRSLPPIAQSYDHRPLHQHGGGTHRQASVDSSSSSHSRVGDKKSQTTDEADHKHQRNYSKSSEKKRSGSSHNEWTSSHDGDPHEDPANSRDAHTSSRDIHANGDKTGFPNSHSRDRDGKKNFRLNLDVLLQDEQLTNLLFAGISKATTKLEQSLKTTDKKMENYASTDDSTSRHKAQQSVQTSSAEGHQKLKSTVKRKTRKERVGVESKVKTESQASLDSFSKLSVLEKTLHLLCGKTNVEDVVRGSEKGSRGSEKPFKPVGTLSQLESYNDSGDDYDHAEKDTKKQTKTKKSAPSTQPFWFKMDQLSQQSGQTPNLASFSQAKKAGDNNEEELDSTVQNILQSIGFNFDLSKRPQELARRKEQQDVLHTGMINQSVSFLGQSDELVKGVRAAVFSDKQKKAQPDSLNKETGASMQKRPDYERSASGDTFSAETQSVKNNYSCKGKNLDPDNGRSRMGLGSHEFRSDRHLENLQNEDWEQISPDEDEIDEIESRQIEKMKTLPHEKHAEVRQWSFSKERNAALSPHDVVLLDEAWKSKDLLHGSHETSLRLSERFREEPKDEYIYQDVSKSIKTAALLAALCSEQKEVSSSGSKSLKLPLQSGSAQIENLRVTSRTVHSDDNKNDEPYIKSRKMSLPSKSDVRIVSQSPVFRKSQSPEMKVPRKRPASPLPCPVSKEKEDRVLNEKRSFSVLQAFLKTSFEKNAPGFYQALGLNMVSCDKLPLLQTLLGGLNVGGLPAAESTRSPVMSDHFDRDSVRKSPDRPTLISADIRTSRLPGMSRSPERRKADVPMSWVPGWPKSRSPDKQKSVSPDPDKRESMSLDRHLSRSPERRSSRLPDKMKSKSPSRQISRSPVRRKSSLPGRSVSKSPDRRKSLSPSRSRSRSPSRSRSGSPDRHGSKSPDRHMSESPDRHGSKSPDRHMSRSPDRHMSGSPDTRSLRSPDSHRSRSPDRHRSRSPDSCGSRSPDRHRSRSPHRRRSRSPNKRGSRSSKRPRARSVKHGKSRLPHRLKTKGPIHIGAIQTWTQQGNEEADAMISNPLPGKLRTAQGQDTTLRPCYKKLQRSADPPNQGQYYMKNRLLYRRAGRGDNLYGQLVVPKDYRPQILRMGHTILFSGHMGIGVMLQRISCHYYWPGMTGDVRRYVKSCAECRRVAPKHWTAPVVLGSMPIMNSLFERVAVDIMGPLPWTRKRNMYILTMVDCFSMWGEAIPLATIDSKRVAEALIEAFTRLGFPNHIITDNWSQFCGKLMEEVFQIFHTNHIHTIPYHPQVNGQVERFNGMLMMMFRKLVQEKPDRWDEYIPAVLFTYREVPHGSTGLPPATLLFGRPIKGPLEAMLRSWTDEGTSKEVISSYKYVEELKEKLHTGWTLVTQNLRKARKRHAAYFYGRSKERSLQVGDKVLLLLPTGNNKLEIGWQGPFPVERVVSRTNYEIQIRGKLKIVHINLLRKYEERTGEESPHLMAMAVAMETDGTR